MCDFRYKTAVIRILFCFVKCSIRNNDLSWGRRAAHLKGGVLVGFWGPDPTVFLPLKEAGRRRGASDFMEMQRAPL